MQVLTQVQAGFGLDVWLINYGLVPQCEYNIYYSGNVIIESSTCAKPSQDAKLA
jgi:hypothetical protein